MTRAARIPACPGQWGETGKARLMTKKGGGGNSMDVREAVKYRESYDSIVTYFKTLKTPGMDQMVLLIDTIEQMSPEIYEHYRALQDIFRMRLKEMLAGGNPGPQEQLAYMIQKGCSTGTLLREKYERYLD